MERILLKLFKVKWKNTANTYVAVHPWLEAGSRTHARTGGAEVPGEVSRSMPAEYYSGTKNLLGQP